MIDRIAIDVTNTEQSAVPKEKFRINKYNFGTPFEDLVHNTEPYLHFQILRPKDEEQREKALTYFKENGKIYATFVNSLVKSIMAQAAHWYRFYGNETNEE